MKKNSNKISMIVPVYNVEKYIKKCVDSLLNQTYKNFEIILVDDGSTDDSGKICDEYASKYEKIKVIHKKNGGLSSARNIGLEESTGDYIGFIDSDDYVDSNYYETMINSIIDSKSDVAIADIKIYYEDSKKTQLSKCFNDEKISKLSVINNGLAASACNKLFKKDIISKYKFAEGKVNEDLAVIIPTIVWANKISYASGTYYYYVQRNNSIQNSKFNDKRFDIFYGVDQTLSRISGCKDYDEYKDAIIFNQIIVLLIYVIPKEKDSQRRLEILKKYNELSSKYNIRQNHYFWKFLDSAGKKGKLYYKLLFKLECSSKYNLANKLIEKYDFLRSISHKSVIKKNINIDDLIECCIKQNKMRDEKLKISVVIPNYNYKRYIYERLYSILSQNYKLYEIVILDDCSSDGSQDEINAIVETLKNYVNIKCIFNNNNSGIAFKQWQKGFLNVTGDYVWIAEADDYCEPDMLKELVKPIKKDKDVVISFCDTAFIDSEGFITYKSIVPEIDIMKTGHFDHSYINDGADEYNNYTFLNNSIANVSSSIIKRDDYEKEFKVAETYKQCGDWVFYVDVMQKGKIAYSSKTYNYYRVHGNNVSSVTKKKDHMKEMQRVHAYFEKKYGLNKEQKKQIEKRYKFLKKVWNIK